MSVNFHVRDVPDEVHETLMRRATSRGMSLRQYTIEVLAEHCALPSIDEWLDSLHRLEPAKTAISGAEAVRESRAEDDASVAAGARSRT
jgi:hypothetical protein